MVTIDEIMQKLQVYNPEINETRIRGAFDYIQHCLRGMYGISGDTMIQHALAVTNNLLSFNVDENSIITALLHDIGKSTLYSEEEVRKKFGEDVFSLILGMDKLQNVHLKGGKSDFEAFRRMFLSLAKDLRLVLIRLADLLDHVESLDYVPQDRRKEEAREMLELYAPIAARLGIYNVKCRLEDVAFKYLYPDKYQDLQAQLEEYMKKQEKFLELIKQQMSDFLLQHGIEGRVEGRLKNLYSIYRKMKRKNKSSIDEIYDIFAFRIIFPNQFDRNGQENTDKLYTFLGIFHNHWTPLLDRFKDYVAVPKPNGYRSLHTTLIGNSNGSFEQPFEVQIRSEIMHQQAEFGIASHWLYEDIKTNSNATQPSRSLDLQQLNSRHHEWLEGMLNIQRDLEQNKGLHSRMELNMFQDHIFVFTPDGAVKDLPRGATPVDFAYAIHTDIGHRCHGAKVNGAIVALDHELKNGDHVEILTTSKPDPKPHWLSFVKSAHSKSKIKSYFNSLSDDKSFRDGKDLVNKYLENFSLPLLDDHLALFRLYGGKKLTLKQRQSLVEDIGNRAVNIAVVMKKILGTTKPLVKKQKKEIDTTQNPLDSLKDHQIFIAGQMDVPYKISSCCKPKLGHPIVGYVSRGNAIRIHRQSCKFLIHADAKRVLEASWGTPLHPQRFYAVTIDLKAIDRVGLLRDIAETIASFNVNIVDFTLQERRENHIHRHIMVEVADEEQYQKILIGLRQIRNVLEVNKMVDEKVFN